MHRIRNNQRRMQSPHLDAILYSVFIAEGLRWV